MQEMKIRANKLFVCTLFMMIFMAKMLISVAPYFISLSNKTVSAVIMQLEQENKNEKEDPEKESSKDKKFFDEDLQWFTHFVQMPVTVEAQTCLNYGHSIYQPDHHSSVPTPPPDARLS